MAVRRRVSLFGGFGYYFPTTRMTKLPGFIFPRRSPGAGAFLDGVNAAALGLIAAVGWQLGRAALVNVTTVVIAVVSALLLLRFRVSSAWLVLGGALAGLVTSAVG